MEPKPIDRLMEAIHAAGEQLLAALEARDFEAVVACAHARDELMAQLPAQERGGDAALVARLARQHQVLDEALQRAYDQLAGALRRSDRYQHATVSYTGPVPPRHRLQARG